MPSRRDFLLNSAAVSAGFFALQGLAGAGLLQSCSPGTKEAGTTAAAQAGFAGFGPLQPDPKGVFELPKGFSYDIIARQGETMADGLLRPGDADAMATFPLDDDRIVIVCNHEITPEHSEIGAFGADNALVSTVAADKIYDKGFGKNVCQGGTTTLIYNQTTGKVEKQWLSLAGTTRNCAGGTTPWGSWLTCEETVDKAGDNLEKDHGYVFEVPAGQEGLAEPIPYKAMGRFNHEAAAVDPASGVVFMTEDDSNGLIYRFVPSEKGNLKAGGRLQALVIKDQPSADVRNWSILQGPKFPLGQAVEVEWIDLQDVESPEDDLRFRGHKAGAAVFARGEGMWMGDGECFWACTNGGDIQKGQVFRYVPSPYEGTDREAEQPGTLELFLEPNDTDLMKYCDNLTVAANGDLVLCEDGEDNHLRYVSREGGISPLGRNVLSGSELAGAVFSPDGKTLFVNIQHDGLTLAIQGPWPAA